MITAAHVDEQSGLRGGELQAAWLVRGLAARGVRNILVGRPGEPFLAMHPDLQDLVRVPLPLRGEWDLYSAFRLARLVRTAGIDILHAHTSHAHGIAALAVLLGAPCRLVVSRRVNFPPKNHVLNRWKYHRPDRILCVSDAVRETLAGFGLDAPQIKTVHSAVDRERALMPAVPRSALNVPESAPFLFSAGSLVDHKDHDNLLKAFALVRAHFPEARLCIAGDGPLRSGLELLRGKLGLDDSVAFLGYREDAPGISRCADVYVSSSWSEGLGTSILEALAAGTPVVATEAGGAAEMVIPGRTGCLVPSRNVEELAGAIIRSLRNRDEARRMAALGTALVAEKFSVERMVQGTLETYRELAG